MNKTLPLADTHDPSAAPLQTAAVPEKYTDANLVNLTFTAWDQTTIHATAYLPTKPRPGFSQEQRFGTVVNVSPYYLQRGQLP